MQRFACSKAQRFLPAMDAAFFVEKQESILPSECFFFDEEIGAT
jgi:hypothetical protein